MSDTTVGYTPGRVGGVAAYVREVRAELTDLPVEDIDDLTGGMEADLTELAADCGGDLAGRLGSPRRYAAELRAAAGLPERVAGPGRRSRPVADALTHARASFTMRTQQHPWLRSVTAFLVTLRPAWWLVRGYLSAWALWSLLGGMRGIRPHGVLQLVLALAAVIVSVQLGRGWLRERVMTGPLLVLGNAAAVVVALIASTSGVASGEAYAYNPPPSPGVSVDGGPVGNIYVYDSDGKRLSGVRLFAQDGRPLNAQSSVDPNGIPVGIDAFANSAAVVRDSSGAPLLNVYPQALAGSEPWQVTNPTTPVYPAAEPPPPPLWSPPMSIGPLTPSSTGTPTSTPTPTATATARTPAKAPTAKPVAPKRISPTPSSGPSPSVTRSGG